MTPSPRDRARGALLGLAAGDALGTTVEFRSPGSFRPLTDIVGGGPFSLRAGQWTDDTSMALCLAESLVARAAFDPVDQLRRYVRWYRRGENSSTGRCFDIGGATAAALARFEQDAGVPFPGDSAPAAAGNGPLMKLAPLPIAYAGDPARAVRLAGQSARTTHGAPQAVDATRAFAQILVAALAGGDKADVLRAARGLQGLHPEVEEVVRGSFDVKEPPEIRGTGYVVHALEAALWAVARHDTYAATALAAANLGDDADTTAAIAGQLAGALYGCNGIPEAWRRKLYRHDDLVALADQLHDLYPRDATPRAEDLPPQGAGASALSAFAHTFDGYAHFGPDRCGERYEAALQAFVQTGDLPVDLDDLRGVLFLAARSIRPADEDTGHVETRPGELEVRDDPDGATDPVVTFQRALVERLRELVATASRSDS